MDPGSRIVLWLFSSLLAALPIYIVLVPSVNDLMVLFDISRYGSASKAIFLFYFSISVVALFNVLEGWSGSNRGSFFRAASFFGLLLILLQVILSALFYRDVYFDRDTISSRFSINLLIWGILQSFSARVFLFMSSATPSPTKKAEPGLGKREPQ
jgi:hypothetical protein